MFKRILASFVGSLAAMFIAGAALFVGFIMLIIGIAASVGSTERSKVDDHSILYLDLNGEIADRQGSINPMGLLEGDAKAQSLEDWFSALELAKNDPKIDGILINCLASTPGFASREELVEALARFKKSGKWIIAYGDAIVQADYYIACVADSIILNPAGLVDVRGIAAHPVFYKNVLDKLGIEMQVVKVGTFKSAVEPYILTGPSEASQLQMREFVGDIWKNVTSTIATNRKVTPAQVNAWADSMIFTRGAKYALDNKVVDAMMYRHQLDEKLKKMTKLDEDEDPRLVTPAEYLAAPPSKEIRKLAKKASKTDDHIAVLYATGEITDYGTESGIVGSTMCKQIIELADDEHVRGMLLRVNSPGGSAFASEQIWEALQYFKSKDKPLYVSMGDYAASGGYYISCGADKIYADRNTLTGSIGIFGLIPCANDLLTNKIGINTYSIATNPQADFPSLTEPMTPAQYAAMQGNVERGYKLFTQRVADGRHLPLDSVYKIAEGRVWTGSRALQIGLIDKIGSMHTTLGDLARKLDMSTEQCISYPEIKPSLLNDILSGLTDEMSARLGSEAVETVNTVTRGDLRRCLYMLHNIDGSQPLQARMPYVIIK